MVNRLVNIIKEYDYKKICFVWGKVSDSLLFIYMVIITVGVSLFSKEYIPLYPLAIILSAIAIAIYIINIIIKLSARKAMNLLLYEKLDFVGYEYCLNYVLENSDYKQTIKINQEYLFLGNAEMFFYKGEFQNALDELNKIDKVKIDNKSKDKYHYWQFNVNLFLRNKDKVLEHKKYFEVKYKQKQNKKVKMIINNFDAMIRIIIDEKYSESSLLLFDDNKSNYLSHMYLDLYMNGLNKKLSGAYNESIKLFEELSKGNEKLFFVREAKRELRVLRAKVGSNE